MSDPKAQTQMLKQLREQHAETVERTKAELKEQQQIRKQIRAALAGEPKTVPQIAEHSGLPSELVLWHLTAMRKYDLVTEVDQQGEYYRYGLSSEGAK